MENGFLKTITSILMLCSLLFLASCGNDRDGEESNGGDEAKRPPVIAFDNGTGIYAVKILKSITITPIVTDAVDPVYTWKDDNGKIIGNEASYTFSSKATGEVYLKFRVDVKGKYAEEELRIDVVDKMIPKVSLIPTYITYVGKPVTLEPSINFKEDATYKWTKGDETLCTEETYTFTPETEGQFKLELIVTNEDGNGKASTTILVSAKPVLSIEFPNNQITVPQGRAACVAPIILNATENAAYVWEVDGVMQQGKTGQTFTFTPQTPGEYKVKVFGTDSEMTKDATQTVVCLESDETKYYRAPKAGSSDKKAKVYELMPAPGQFVGQLAGSTMQDACLDAEKRMSANNYVSLGAWGGYIVVGLDHSVYNKPTKNGDDGYDFSIIGNPFKGSSEQGIVYVMQDENGNGKPDDTWYELRGSETNKAETYRNYAVTYFRPPAGNMPLQWTDNQGHSGSIDINPQFPKWMKQDQYTLYGTRLKSNTRLEDMWYNDAYPWGYADNWGEDILTDSDNHDAAPVGNTLKIENAMYPDGKPVNLRYIDFIKVQTGIQVKAGVLGELSTEVFGFVDYRMEEAPQAIN